MSNVGTDMNGFPIYLFCRQADGQNKKRDDGQG
jgi:hypothetical protein